MAYMNVDLDYFDHPQTVRLVCLAGRGAAELPLRLWAYCGKFYAENGRLTGHSPQEIEGIIKWWGAPGKAIEALCAEGVDYLGKDEKGYFAKNWKKHQGHIFALKVKGQAMAAARWEKARGAGDARSNADSNAVGIARSNAPTLPTSPNQPSIPKRPTSPTPQGVGARPVLRSGPRQVDGQGGKEVTEEDLYEIRMPFGEFKGVAIINLEPSYCEWLLNEWAGRENLDARTRAALTLRVRLKHDESRRS